MNLTIEVESCDYRENKPPRQQPGPDKQERPCACGGGAAAARPRGGPPGERHVQAPLQREEYLLGSKDLGFLRLYYIIILSLSQILFSKSLHDSIHSRNTSSGARHYLMSGSSGHVVRITSSTGCTRLLLQGFCSVIF